MHEVVDSITVSRRPHVVWPVLADFAGIARWAPNVDHSSLTTAMTDGLGATRRVQVGRTALLETITDWQPELRLAYELQGLPPVVRSAINTWTLEPVAASTVVTLQTAIDAGPRPPQQVVARVIGRVMAKASEQMLAGLKAHIEEST